VRRSETGVASAPAKPREEEEEEAAEEEAPPAKEKRVARSAAKPRDDEESSAVSSEIVAALAAANEKIVELNDTVEAHDTFIIILAKFAASLASEIGMEVPEEIKPLLDLTDADGAEETDEAPPAKKAAKSKDEEEDEDDEEEEEDEETLDISSEELESATVERLTEIATAINESGKGEIKIVKSARIMRDAIRDFLNKNAEVVTTEDPKSKKTGQIPQKKTLEVPEGFRLGAKVEVNFGEDGGWQPGAIQTIDDVEGKCDVTLDDGEECEAEWSEMRVKSAEPKKRVVKKS
jgi:hypothetical protein